jgi:autotransporter translocation and assembly factor TamB
MNAELALVADSLERIPDLPFDLQITAYDNRFDLVSFLLPSVEQMEGDFTADIHLTGTPSDPHLEGNSSLIGGRLKYFDLVEDIYTDTARITMRDNRIELSNVAAYVIDNKKKDTSYVYIGGDITVKALDNFVYDLDVSIPRALHFTYELEDIEGVVEGELQVQGETPPTVSGDLTLISARYRVPFAEVNEGSPVLAALTQQNSWNLDLNIDILSNYWIQNEDIDAEFSGNINLIRDRGRYRFIGEMDILRGKGFLFDKVLRIDQGSQVIFEDIEYLNPRLDITARTRIAGIKFDEEDNAESIELGVHITGTLDVPEINTVEDSEFSREDILPLIALNYYGSGSEGYNGALEQRVTQLVGAQVSRIGTRQLGRLGVETFEIDPVYGGEFDLAKSRVTLGLYTLPGLYVYGKSALSGNTGQEVGFEYRISRQLMVLGQRTEEEEYLLNLKLNWEF